jgi:heme exporter protein A
MTGLSRPDAGTVECSVDKGRIAYLGHATFLYPGLTAAGNLAFWAGVSGRAPTHGDIAAVLDRVGLAPFAEERAGVFSRGMAQRLNLARVFLLAPDLLFLDEPATGLDSRSKAVLDRELAAARDRGATLVLVSHDLRRDLGLADRALWLAGKRAAYLGPAAGFPLEEACAC